MALQINVPAPHFTLLSKTSEGLVQVVLADLLKVGPVVLLFFPAAFTGVCTTEMCDVSGGLHGLEGAKVVGISVDSPFAQEAWAKSSGISVTLVSDYQRETIKAYDVVLPDLAGLGPGSKRAAFLIDQSGLIRWAEETETPLILPNFESLKATLVAL